MLEMKFELFFCTAYCAPPKTELFQPMKVVENLNMSLLKREAGVISSFWQLKALYDLNPNIAVTSR